MQLNVSSDPKKIFDDLNQLPLFYILNDHLKMKFVIYQNDFDLVIN